MIWFKLYFIVGNLTTVRYKGLGELERIWYNEKK